MSFVGESHRHKLKWLSAVIFVLFGIVGVYEVLFSKIGINYTALALGLMTVVSAVLMYAVSKRQKPVEYPLVCKKQA